MCILFIAVKQHPKYPLIIAANRDEFHKRPTSASEFLLSDNILAGKDEEAGGTWMGINKQGRIAALTNIRAPGREVANAITRGNLVLDWLKDNTVATKDTANAYRSEIGKDRASYNGYNLLFGRLDDLYVYNNFEDSFMHLEKGVFGLSNANLDSPWPKIMKGREALAQSCNKAGELDKEELFSILADNQKAKDEVLPKTGVPIEWERKLSSIFIKTPDYGTRSSTLLTVDNEQNVYWQERTFNPNAELTNTEEFKFNIKDS